MITAYLYRGVKDFLWTNLEKKAPHNFKKNKKNKKERGYTHLFSLYIIPNNHL